VLVPTNDRNVNFHSRAWDYSAAAAVGTSSGASLIQTQLLAASFIDVLRPKSRVIQAGASILSGLVGNVDIPRQTSYVTPTWQAEGTDASQESANFDKITLMPKHLSAQSLITRNMLQKPPQLWKRW